jgi:hypothetical protein
MPHRVGHTAALPPGQRFGYTGGRSSARVALFSVYPCFSGRLLVIAAIGAVDLETNEVALLVGQLAHSLVPFGGPVLSPNGGRFSCSRIGVNGGCTVCRRCQLAPSTTNEWPLM